MNDFKLHGASDKRSFMEESGKTNAKKSFSKSWANEPIIKEQTE